MTTVAAKGGVVAADTQLTGGGRTMRAMKLMRLPDGGVAATCGDFSAGYAVLRWLSEGQPGDCPDMDGAEVLIVRPDHSLHLAAGRWPAFPLLDDFYAMGSGSDLAMKAMQDGKGAEEAVQAAISIDLNTSAPIVAMDVERVEFSPARVWPPKRKRK